jgi:hypothetical protein
MARISSSDRSNGSISREPNPQAQESAEWPRLSVPLGSECDTTEVDCGGETTICGQADEAGVLELELSDRAVEGGSGFLVDPRDDTAIVPLSAGPVVHADVEQQLLDMQALVGKRLGPFEILEPLGRGGMGAVFKARQIDTDQHFAVKVVLTGRLSSPTDVARFHGEARAAGRLSHPRIVKVHSVGESDGYHFFAMDHVPGPTLADRLAGQPLPEGQAVGWVAEIAEAVEYAHQQGVLHRDLKPANILLDAEQSPHITDFGLARVMTEDLGLTVEGAAIGTPSYMPPEQAAGRLEAIGPASDVYSLGAILFELLAGRPPFREATSVDTMIAVLQEDAPPLSRFRPTVSPALEAICHKCLAKEPVDRYATAADLAADLGRYLQGERVHARRLSRGQLLWQFLKDVPVVAGILGERAKRPTLWHQRVNRLIVAGLIALIGSLALAAFWPESLPDEIRVVASLADVPDDELTGVALQLAASLDRPSPALPTANDADSRARLLDGRADLAITSASTSLDPELAVVAPLYYEHLWILARTTSKIDSLTAFRGHHLAIGPTGSREHRLARDILQQLALDSESDLSLSDESIWDIARKPRLDGALGLASSASQPLRELLASGEFRLVGLPYSSVLEQAYPDFQARRILPDDVPSNIDLPPGGLDSLVTPRVLVARRDASPLLVRHTLASLLDGPRPDHWLTPSDFRRWSHLPWHPATRNVLASVGR